MIRRAKLITTITTMCLALVMLAFGVYASTIVSFDIGGKVSYKIEDAYVNITTKIYSHNMYSANRNTFNNTIVEENGAVLQNYGIKSFPTTQLYNKVEELSSTKLSEIDTNEYNFVKEYSYSSVTDGEPTPITDLDLEFNSTNALTYFIVINIENLTDEPVYAVIQDNIVNAENTVQINTGVQQNIVKGEENRNIVIGFGIADLTTPIDENSATKAFSYGIKVGLGDITETEENKAKLSINYNSSLGGYLASINQTAKGAVVVPATYDDGTNNEKNVVATAPIKIPSGTTIAAMLELINPGVTCVVLPSTVTNIVDASFAVNIALTKITGLENVQSFGTYALAGCISLAKVSLPTNYTAGAYSFYNCCSLASFDIPTNMTSVPESMLGDCTSLTSIDLKNVTSIGESAFSECTGLIDIDFGKVQEIGGWTFSGCTGLTSLTIPDSVSTIGDWAFHDCTGLTSVTIPDSVETIGAGAFSYCTGLTSLTIPDSVETIGDEAFSHCTGLTSITIPNSVSTIGDWAFSHCTGLTSITIPNSVSTIGDWAFSHCTGLKSVLIEEGGENLEIGDYTFDECTGLTSITLPDRLISIGIYAFYGCDGLENISIGDNIEKIGLDAFINTKYYNTSSNWQNDLLYLTSRGNKKYLIEAIFSLSVNFNLPEDVQVVADGILSQTSLANITVDENNPRYTSKIGGVETNTIIRVGEDNTTYTIVTGNKNSVLVEGITEIGDHAFVYSDISGEITIPNSVTAIGDSAFIQCEKITKITIPDSVVSIGSNAFSWWKNTQEINFLGTMPENLDTEWKHNCNAKIYLNGEEWTGA